MEGKNSFRCIVGNYKTRVIVKGKGKEVLLIHGLGGSANSWINTINFLSKDFKVIAPDLLGFGYSDKPNIDYTIEDYVNFLFELFKTLELKKASLVGSSLGGQIASWFTIEYPSLVEKLVLVCSAGISLENTEALKKYTKEDYSFEGIKERLKACVKDESLIKDEMVQDFLNFSKLKGFKRAFKRALISSFKKERLKLDKINCPTLIVWGKEDNLIPVKYAYEFHKGIKNSKLVILNCGHLPYLEEAKTFNNILRDFLI
ncbi:2-hydroxy-6-oxo-6-(2'-aminophenyl)hexa-2, 4-dienoic acid hydrolase [archaeon HR06]|nr:2-hydroxy-6-oxo-6-(2'-aminophenyl)hexa-2, 4-dienoic acid hydrolase [archaeon HR06]